MKNSILIIALSLVLAGGLSIGHTSDTGDITPSGAPYIAVEGEYLDSDLKNNNIDTESIEKAIKRAEKAAERAEKAADRSEK